MYTRCVKKTFVTTKTKTKLLVLELRLFPVYVEPHSIVKMAQYLMYNALNCIQLVILCTLCVENSLITAPHSAVRHMRKPNKLHLAICIMKHDS